MVRVDRALLWWDRYHKHVAGFVDPSIRRSGEYAREI